MNKNPQKLNFLRSPSLPVFRSLAQTWVQIQFEIFKVHLVFAEVCLECQMDNFCSFVTIQLVPLSQTSSFKPR